MLQTTKSRGRGNRALSVKAHASCTPRQRGQAQSPKGVGRKKERGARLHSMLLQGVAFCLGGVALHRRRPLNSSQKTEHHRRLQCTSTMRRAEAETQNSDFDSSAAKFFPVVMERTALRILIIDGKSLTRRRLATNYSRVVSR